MKRLINAILGYWWSWRLCRLKRKTGVLGFHPYPPDTETGWRKARKDFYGIKSASKLFSLFLALMLLGPSAGASILRVNEQTFCIPATHHCEWFRAYYWPFDWTLLCVEHKVDDGPWLPLGNRTEFNYNKAPIQMSFTL